MALGFIWFILMGSLYLFSAFFLYRTSPWLAGLVVFIAVLDFIFRGIRPGLSRYLKNRKIRKTINNIISEHLRVLARKRGDKVWTDDYGLVHYEDWEQEKEYFIDRVIGGYFPDLQEDDFPIPAYKIDTMIEKRIDNFIGKGLDGGTIREYQGERWEDDGQQAYRQYCAGLLTLTGWKVDPLDTESLRNDPIIATKGDRKFVVTCIKASSPVGKRHFRKTYQAMQRHHADMGAVVTNTEFSRWARWTSSGYGVQGLHHDDLTSVE